MMHYIEYWNIYKQIADIFFDKYIDVTIPHTITKKNTPLYLEKYARTWHPEKEYSWLFQIGEHCAFIDSSTLNSICAKFDFTFDLYYGKKINMISFHKKYIDRTARYQLPSDDN